MMKTVSGSGCSLFFTGKAGKKSMNEKKKRNRRILFWILVAAFCVWLFADVFPGHLSRRMAYRKAESLIDAGDYVAAEEQIGRLTGIGAYDREYLQMYCRFYPLYLEGKLREAAEQYDKLYHDGYYHEKMTVWDQSWLDWKAVYAIRDERTRIDKEETERRQAEYEAWKIQQEKEYQEKVVTSEMPFLGMKEEDVGKTKLGGYYGNAWEKNESYWYNDKQYRPDRQRRVGKRKVKNYAFLKDGEIYLEVFCTNGRVDELARHEDDMIYYSWIRSLEDDIYEGTYRKTWYPNGFWYKRRKTGSLSGTGKKKTSRDNYGNEEDFYEDYADEFEDLDEAMDYYLDHYQ